MKILCISDTHGYLPILDEEVDILIHAGDFSSCWIDDKSFIKQYEFITKKIYGWLQLVKAKYKIIVPGNHDRIFETKFTEVADIRRKFSEIGTFFLIDKAIKVEGLKIYGTPWQPFFHSWAFNAPENDIEEDFLNSKFRQIPDNTDILITHCPPYGILDFVKQDNLHVGSKALLKHVLRVKPKWHIFGHIHEGSGQIVKDDINFINATYVDGQYRPNGKHWIIEV